jgi:hypothetical protein
MRRFSALPAALLCALTLPAISLAASSGHRRAHAAAVSVHPATGTVVDAGGYELTIQTNGRWMGRINAMTATATRITHQDYSYVWGGGHAEAGIASVGERGPGFTGRTSGYDCSGSVAAVLVGGGLWPAGAGVPNDAGVISELLAERLIARGPGTGPSEVTLYDDPGVHIFMNIDGRFFGTSDGAGGGSGKGGPGWLNDGAHDAFDRAYRQYHIVPGVLGNRTSYGHDLTFQTTQTPQLVAAVQPGDRVRVAYSDASAGEMLLQDLSFVGATTVSATVTSVGSDGLVVTPSSGAALTLGVPTAALLSGVSAGDTVSVTYTSRKGVELARSITVTAQPVPPTPPADPTQTTTDPTPATTDPTQTTTDPTPATTDPTQTPQSTTDPTQGSGAPSWFNGGGSGGWPSG